MASVRLRNRLVDKRLNDRATFVSYTNLSEWLEVKVVFGDRFRPRFF